MRLANVVATLVSTAFAVPIGYFVYMTYAPHLLLDGTTRYLHQYRDLSRRDGEVDLVPGLLEIGEAKEDVERRFVSGFERWDPAPEYLVLPAGAASIHRFRLVTGLRDFVCSSELYVTIGYDAADRVSSATVKQGGVCL